LSKSKYINLALAVSVALLLMPVLACNSELEYVKPALATVPSATRVLTPTPQPETVSVKLALDWYPNSNHLGFYIAQNKGYFADENLDVELYTPVDPSTVLQTVGAGQDDFGISYQPDVLMARAQGVPVVSVAGIVQQHRGLQHLPIAALIGGQRRRQALPKLRQGLDDGAADGFGRRFGGNFRSQADRGGREAIVIVHKIRYNSLIGYHQPVLSTSYQPLNYELPAIVGRRPRLGDTASYPCAAW